MGPYTQTFNPEAEALVASHLRWIVQRTLGCVPEGEILTILLTGGFGRGEGSVRVTAEGPRVMNDYDLAVVPRASSMAGFLAFVRRYQGGIDEAAREAAHELGVKQVDLSIRPHGYFRSPPELRIENYEVLVGHRVVYGETDPCGWMPAWKASDLPLFDGIWLFRNRGLGLLMARMYLELGHGGLAASDRENFFIECNKARLAMGDSILLAKGIYHGHYRERLRLARVLRQEGADGMEPVLDGYVDGLEQKLWTEERHLHIDDPMGFWRGIAEMFRGHFLWFESRRLGTTVRDWEHYSELARPERRTRLKTVAMALVRSRGRGLRKACFVANRGKGIEVVGLLLEALAQPGARRSALARAAAILGVPDTGDWIRLVTEFIRAVHPGGEAGRIVARVEALRAA